jgi:hypothetical protein
MAQLRITSTGRVTNTAVLQTPAGLNIGGASKPWMWVLQSRDYLSSDLLMTCRVCGLFLCTSWSCTGAEVQLHSFLTSALKWVTIQPHDPQFHPRRQLSFARWLWEPQSTSGGFRTQKCFTRRETNYDSSDVQAVALSLNWLSYAGQSEYITCY